MIITEIVNSEVKYDRTAELSIIDDKVIFDTSNGEYGEYTFNLSFLELKIKEHKLKQQADNGKII